MRPAIQLIAALLLTAVAASSQTINKQPWTGIWTEKQNGHASIHWLFEGNDEFAQVSNWANGQELGSIIRKGKIAVDTTTKRIQLHFITTVNASDNTINTSNEYKEWKLISADQDKIVISRPPVWKDEDPRKQGDGKNVYVTLVKVVKPAE